MIKSACAMLLAAGLATSASGQAEPNRNPSQVRLDRHATNAGGDVDFYLTALHNNDGESQIISAPGEPEYGGIDRFATLVDLLRAEAALKGGGLIDSGSILVSAGDNILAGPEFNASLDLPDGEPFYDAVALREIGYDVLGTGNHEFDFNPDVFEQLILGVNPLGIDPADIIPFVTVNLDFSDEPGLLALEPDRLADSKVVEVEGRLVGIVGATTENLPFITSTRNIIVNPVLPALQAEIDRLISDGVSIIGVTSHLQSVDEELSLVAELRGVDFIIAGGGDDLIADEGTPLVPGDEIDRVGYPLSAVDPDGRTVYVVSTTGDYKYVGRLVMGFDAGGEIVEIGDESNVVRVASTAVDPERGVEPDPVVKELVVDPVIAYVMDLAEDVIGATEVPLDGVRSQIRSRETNLGNLITDSYLDLADRIGDDFGIEGPVIAVANGGGIRNDNVIPVGDLTALDTFDILPFGNNVSAVEPLPAEQIKEILENAVSRIEAGTGDAVGDGTGRFAQVGGIFFSYDARRQAIDFDEDRNTIVEGFRVREAVLADGTVIIAAGEVLPGAPDITILTADFTANGGDEYPFRGASFQRLGVDYQRSLQDFVQNQLPGSVITAEDYPEGGEGRVVNLEFGDLIVQSGEADIAAPYGQINILDAVVFFDAYFQGRTSADLAEPFGEINRADFVRFVFAYLFRF